MSSAPPFESTAPQDSWAPAEELEKSSRQLIGEFGDLKLFQLSPGVFGLILAGHFGREPLLAAMRRSWSDESSEQGWGMVVVVTPELSYDPDARTVYKAPDLRPAAHVAVVTQRLLHRVVITSLSLPVRAATGSVLSVHAKLEPAWQGVEGTVQALRFESTGS